MRRLIVSGIAAMTLLAMPAIAQTTQTQPAPAKPAPAMVAPPTAAPAHKMAPAAQPAPAKPAAAAKVELLDINMASKAQLEALKGVGPVRADAIIKGRPYKGKDDLVQKKILPQNVYNDVKDKIIARQH